MAGSDYSEEAETAARRVWESSSVADIRPVIRILHVAACGWHRRGGFQTLPDSPPSTYGVQECVFPSGRPRPLPHNAG